MSRFYWKCPMCAMGIRKEAEVSELKNGTKVCATCAARAKGRKTMTFEKFKRLCIVNSPKVPLAEIGGTRRRWVGFGLVEEGPAEGNEVVITP